MKWEKKDIDPQRVRDMAAAYGCDLLTASILSRRGIDSGEAAKFYLEDDSRHLHNPFLLPAMEDAVERILAAKEEGEKVLVFGDRDVDGITSTTILVQALRGMGIDVSWQVPLGDESYGLSIEAVERFAKEFGSLIITVDCGISNLQEIAHAQELGVQTIVVDHHHPGQELPLAFAIVNPKIPDCGYPFADLAGCAVAWKLTQALRWAQNTQLFNQNICLLNTRPINDAWLIEMVKLRNMVVQEVLIETVVPGMVSIAQTRLPDFLQGQQIMVWDANVQQKGLNRIFGGSVEFAMLDISDEIGKEIPSVAGKSLLRIKELSRIARYSDTPLSELDVFLNLFTSFIHRREKS
jgi:single-stranded-DNA-specific exonuclease